jgi:hypothetical protein
VIAAAVASAPAAVGVEREPAASRADASGAAGDARGAASSARRALAAAGGLSADGDGTVGSTRRPVKARAASPPSISDLESEIARSRSGSSASSGSRPSRPMLNQVDLMRWAGDAEA